MEYYTPAIQYKQLLTDENLKRRKVTFEDKGLKDIISTYMYTDPKAAFRELYANAVRSCKEAKIKHNADPRIEITVNPSNMEFSMIEYNSMGITNDVFENIMSVLGRSGNFDGTLPGQFGIGFISYYALSDLVSIESYARDGDRLNQLGINGDEFVDISSRNDPTLKSFGTKISLKMQKLRQRPKKYDRRHTDHQARLIDVFLYLEDLCKFSEITTTITITEPVTVQWQGTIKLGPLNPMREMTKYKKNVDEDDFIVISNNDYDLIGNPFTINKLGSSFSMNKVMLAGMPVPLVNETLYMQGDIPHNDMLRNEIIGRANLDRSKVRIHDFLNLFWINVKNERKYRPTASRDNIMNEDLTVLAGKIRSDFINYVGKFENVNTMDSWLNLNARDKSFIRRMITHFKEQILLKYPKTRDMLNLVALADIRCDCNVNAKYVTFNSFEVIFKTLSDEEKENMICMQKP